MKHEMDRIRRRDGNGNERTMMKGLELGGRSQQAKGSSKGSG
jgi:hypothetical protein